MKDIFTSLLLFIVVLQTASGQNYYCAAFPDQDGNVELSLPDYCGLEVQWQVRDVASTEWVDIVGANTNPFLYEATPAQIDGKVFQAKVLMHPDTIPKYSYPFSIKLLDELDDLSVGDFYNESFVYYQSNDTILGGHFVDFLEAPWGCYEEEITGADGLMTGTGEQNTVDILAECEEEGTAAKISSELALGGHNDWSLPSIEEAEHLLETLRGNRIQQIRLDLYELNHLDSDAFGQSNNIVISKDYWSSSELSATHARSAKVYNGSIFDGLNAQKIVHKGVLLSRRISSTAMNSNRCSAIIFPFQFTNHISVAPVDGSRSKMRVEYIGDEYADSDYTWDFGKGTVVSGEGKGPYEVEYAYGGHNRVSMSFTNEECKSPYFFSSIFQVELMENIGAPFPRVYGGIARAVDFNNDELLDVFISGSDTTALYENLGQNTFDRVATIFPNLASSRCSWGDYDNDGWADLVLSGYTPVDSIPSTLLFKNLGNGSFVEIAANLPGVARGFVEWIDFNNDGHLDLLVSGEDINGDEQTMLFAGNGSASFSEVENDLPDLTRSSVAIGDYNRDNYPDLVILGSMDTTRVSQIFKNANGDFVALDAMLTGVNDGSATWSDFNNDGYLDVLISGNEKDMTIEQLGGSLDVNAGRRIAVAKIYHYLGDDTFVFGNNPTDRVHRFSDVPQAGGFTRSAVEAGDFDNDGWSDFVITGMPPVIWVAVGIGGSPSVNYRSQPSIYRNLAQDTFEDIEANLPATWTVNTLTHVVMNAFESSSISFDDFNNDGKLDILREGRKDSHTSAIYLNGLSTGNNAPQGPNMLDALVTCDSILLSWNSALDDHTPTSSLTYEFYIGTTPNGDDVFSKKNIRKLRNTFFKLGSLPDGVYYWSVKAVDDAKASSVYAEEQTFSVNCTTNFTDVAADYDISIFPNPFSDRYTISVVGTSAPIHYECINQLGQVLLQGTFETSTEINTASWGAGVYYLRLLVAGEQVIRRVVRVE